MQRGQPPRLGYFFDLKGKVSNLKDFCRVITANDTISPQLMVLSVRCCIHWNISLPCKKTPCITASSLKMLLQHVCLYNQVTIEKTCCSRPQRPQRNDPAWLAPWKLPSVFVIVIWEASAVGMLAFSPHSRIMEQFGAPLTFINDNYLSIMFQTQIIHLHGVAIREALSRFARANCQRAEVAFVEHPFKPLAAFVGYQRPHGRSAQDLYFEIHLCCSGSLHLPVPHC